MSGDEMVRHDKSGPREAFFHGRSVIDRCDVCSLKLQNNEMLKVLELTRRWMLGGQPGPDSDSKLLDVIDMVLGKTQKRECEHDFQVPFDGVEVKVYDLCTKCGVRRWPEKQA